MSQAHQAVLLRETHRNHYLFSDYYLNHRVQQREEWLVAEVREVFGALQGLWGQFTPRGDNEAQTEMEWIRPVLALLGHCFTVQVPLKTPLGRRIPDYLFYADEAARVVVKGELLTEQTLGGAVAVGDAKAWGRSLDVGSIKAGQQISQNPSLQIDFYIRYTGLRWGLLTNGLYRLLFTFYAESRQFIPVGENEAYTRHYSLYTLIRPTPEDRYERRERAALALLSHPPFYPSVLSHPPFYPSVLYNPCPITQESPNHDQTYPFENSFLCPFAHFDGYRQLHHQAHLAPAAGAIPRSS